MGRLPGPLPLPPPGCPIKEQFLLSFWGWDLPEQVPEESGEFAGERDVDLCLHDAAVEEVPPALVEPDLDLPGELLVHGRLPLLAERQPGRHLGWRQRLLDLK